MGKPCFSCGKEVEIPLKQTKWQDGSLCEVCATEDFVKVDEQKTKEKWSAEQ